MLRWGAANDSQTSQPSKRRFHTHEDRFVKIITINIQSTPVISNSKGLTETLRDIRTSTYQSWESEENNKLNNHI